MLLLMNWSQNCPLRCYESIVRIVVHLRCKHKYHCIEVKGSVIIPMGRGIMFMADLWPTRSQTHVHRRYDKLSFLWLMVWKGTRNNLRPLSSKSGHFWSCCPITMIIIQRFRKLCYPQSYFDLSKRTILQSLSWCYSTLLIHFDACSLMPVPRSSTLCSEITA